MYWDIIEERIKGFDYAKEPQRLCLNVANQATFEGRHKIHILSHVNDVWTCKCFAYQSLKVLPGNSWCRHTIAVERILNALEASACPPMYGTVAAC